MAQVDDARNLYGEALTALDEANNSMLPVGGDAETMVALAQLQATKAAALASLAAADASFAVRNELEALGGKLAQSS